MLQGIPFFYRWLVERYPLASLPVTHDGPLPPVDNLFLDMNGISEWGGVGLSP
jgi:5'-3' exonuclease